MHFLIILKAILLGVVEGITEFLPVSSTGHMIIVDEFVKLSSDKSFSVSFEIIIQLGAILSVIVYFFKDLWPFSNDKENSKRIIDTWKKVVIGVLPAVVLGLLFDDFIEEKLFNPIVVSIALVIYGIIIILIERFYKNKNSIDTMEGITYKKAVIIGFFQCLAMVPGTSRSAATIIGGLLLGLNRTIAAEYSFFLAIPTMFGATFLKVVKTGINFTGFQWLVIFTGFVTAFIVAYAVIKYFMEFIKKNSIEIFGIYRILFGFAVLYIMRK